MSVSIQVIVYIVATVPPLLLGWHLLMSGAWWPAVIAFSVAQVGVYAGLRVNHMLLGAWRRRQLQRLADEWSSMLGSEVGDHGPSPEESYRFRNDESEAGE